MTGNTNGTIEALSQAIRRISEAIYIANALFSIPVHTDDRDQFAFCVTDCNTPLMSLHKAMSSKKLYSHTALVFRYIDNSLLVGPGEAST